MPWPLLLATLALLLPHCFCERRGSASLARLRLAPRVVMTSPCCPCIYYSYLVKALRPTTAELSGGAAGITTTAPVVAAPLWVNRLQASNLPGTSLMACFPGPGRQEGEPLLAARRASDNAGTAWQLNMYPVSRDAGTGPASSLWYAGTADLSPLMQWALELAASASGPLAPPEVRAAIRAAISRGVPLWNEGRHDRCTEIYMAVCRRLGVADVRLRGAAVRAASENPTDGGWTLRNAMDAVLRDIANGTPLQEAATAAPPGAARGSRGVDTLLPEMDMQTLFRALRRTLIEDEWGEPSTVGLMRAFVDELNDDGSGDLCDTIEHAIHAGVPVWNSGDYAGCACIYRAVATVFQAEARQLQVALEACEGQPLTAASDSQGWILRRAFDDILSDGPDEIEDEDEDEDKDQKLEDGATVTVVGLTTRTDLNGRQGTVKGDGPNEQGRWSVEIDGKMVGVRRSSLELLNPEDNYDEGVDYDAIPGRMVCPITQRLVRDPVICADGTTYERKAIKAWFRKHDTSPLTNLKISKTLIPNLTLKEEAVEWLAEHRKRLAAARAGAAAAVCGVRFADAELPKDSHKFVIPIASESKVDKVDLPEPSIPELQPKPNTIQENIAKQEEEELKLAIAESLSMGIAAKNAKDAETKSVPTAPPEFASPTPTPGIARHIAYDEPDDDTLGPIRGVFDDAANPIVPITAAVEVMPIDISSELFQAKRFIKKKRTKEEIAKYPGLTSCMAAAIFIYTCECPLYHKLNELLRDRNRAELRGQPGKTFFPYIRLLFSGIRTMASGQSKMLNRGVKLDLVSVNSDKFCEDESVIWWSFSSCTSRLSVLKNPLFLGETGDRTIFQVMTTKAVNIEEFSAVKNEAEWLLPAGCVFNITGVLNKDPSGLTIISLEDDNEAPEMIM